MDRAILVKFGRRVRKLRLDRKLSQEKLALLAGLDRTYISGIERGTRNPSLLSIGRVALALDEEPAVLLVLDEEGIKHGCL